MYCTTCGKQIIDTARFCNYCGSPVAGAAFTAPAANVQNSPAAAPVPAPAAAPVPAESTNVSASAAAPGTDMASDTNSMPVQSGLPEEKNTVSEPLNSEYSETASENASTAKPQTADNGSGFESSQTAAYSEAPAVPELPAQPLYGTGSPSVSEPMSNTGAAGAYSLPAPSQIPVSGEGNINVAAVPENPAKPLPERKYTLGHIMMCLCAVAVMAIVAGVFAGLYFSVV